jgi:transcriptional regulator with XRE-family HTH domain
MSIAEAMRLSQSAVSKLERRSDPTVSALQQYVASLGATLEVVARFPDATVRLELAAPAERPVLYSQGAPLRRVAERPAFVMPPDWSAEVVRIRSLPPEVRLEEIANITEFFAEATRRG